MTFTRTHVDEITGLHVAATLAPEPHGGVPPAPAACSHVVTLENRSGSGYRVDVSGICDSSLAFPAGQTPQSWTRNQVELLPARRPKPVPIPWDIVASGDPLPPGHATSTVDTSIVVKQWQDASAWKTGKHQIETGGLRLDCAAL